MYVGDCHSSTRGHVLDVSSGLISTVDVRASEVPVLSDDQSIVQVRNGTARVAALKYSLKSSIL